MGVVSPVGNDLETTWNNLINGVCGIAPIKTFDTTDLPVKIAGELKDFDPIASGVDKGFVKRNDRFAIYAMAAAAQAMKDGFGFRKAAEDLESFTAAEEYTEEARSLISELDKASGEAVAALMESLNGKAAALLEAGNFDGAVNVYTTDIGPLAPESRPLREQKIAEIERMKRNDDPEKAGSPQEGPPQP